MPKRRANGEGNIRKRKDGRWEGRYTVGHDPETGKAIIKNVLGKTQAEVKEKLKAAISEKFAVLSPGHAGFPKRVKRSEGSDTTPPPKTPPVSPCVPLCAIFLRKPSVYPLSLVKANVDHLCERLKNAMKDGLR